MRLFTNVLMLCCVAVVVTACGGASRVTMGHGSDLLPDESLEDWKSYADHLVVFTVEAERALPLDDDTEEHGEGVQAREITLRIDDILWSAQGAPKLPSPLTLGGLGWVIHDGERREFWLEGAPRPAVGEQYLSPMVRFDDRARPEWGPLTQSSQMPLAAGRVKPGEADTPVRERFAGKSVQELADAFLAQEPSALAAEFEHLRPAERIHAVNREKARQRGEQVQGP